MDYVKVTLTIRVAVDTEYSPDEHAKDIVESTKRLFPVAEIDVLDVQTDQLSEPKLSA